MNSALDRTDGFFLSLEGGDGCGKSTQIKLLGKHLKKNKVPHLLTGEPGGTKLGASLTRLLLDPKRGGMAARAELFLYLADRAQHVDEIILPALNQGKLVVTSRYADATVAYQAYGRGLPLGEILAADELAAGGLVPDLTVLLDVDPAAGLKRLRGKTDRLEGEKLEFHQRVRHGYNMLVKAEPGRIKLVDASLPVGKVHQQIVKLLGHGAGIGKQNSEF